MEKDASKDILEFLDKDEYPEHIVFGKWGWSGYREPNPPIIPKSKRGKVFIWEDAIPYMKGWSVFGGFGCPECYAIRLWTNKRVIWITQYDGATSLDSALRNPEDHIPNMPGG